MHRRLENLGRIAALIVVGSVTLAAQGTQTSSITGSVVEANGAGMIGATIRLTSPSLQGARVLATGEKGAFTTRLLPPGVYTIEITKTGFQTIKTVEKIGMDQNYQPRFTMVKTAGVTVEVVATLPALDKTDVKTSSNYSLDAVDQLPNTRTQEGVALLSPGVVSGVGGRVQIRGAMTSGNLYLVDGQNVSDNAYGNRGSRLIDDAIEETQVITGAISAEYGSVDGGVINSITRSGSNTFSGQIRDELSNPQWNAMQPYQNRATVANALSEAKTISLGGFILKDKLWFYTSYFRTSANNSASAISSSAAAQIAPGGANANYNYNKEEIRRQVKLTYLVNPNHTLVASWMNSQNGENFRDYSAGELAALIPQSYKDSLYNVALRSVWSPSVTSDIRYGEKKQTFFAGPAGLDPTNVGNSPIYDDNTGFYYNHGIFNSSDGGDNRNNKTFAAKVSVFWDAMGTHQTDMGVDYYKGIRQARNEQTSTGYILEGGFDANARTVDVYNGALWKYWSAGGQAISETKSLYVNDKWSVDNKLSFQIGMRFDKYSAQNDQGSSTVSANGFSPRLGLKYDVLGDGAWILGASWARYNSAVAEGITTQVTNQGNPKEIDFYYSGPATAGLGTAKSPYTAIYGTGNGSPAFNLANYSQTAANIAYYNNPTLNVKLANDLKAPHADETQLSAAYAFKTEVIGDGFVRLTWVNKEWHDMLDYKQGMMGQVLDTDYGYSPYLKVWGNSSIAQRKYHDLELDAQATKGKFVFTGNVTWASLKGNYEGEGSSTPARGEGLEGWTTTYIPATGIPAAANGVAHTVNFSRDVTAPYGALVGDVPLRIRATAAYVTEGTYGKTTWGLVYRFDSGSHISDARSLSVARVDPDMANVGAGSTFTQYKNGVRGNIVTPGQSYLDLAVTQDWQLAKVAGTPVYAFAKVAITNVLNHQQIISWNTTSSPATGAANTPTGGINSPWVYGASYGKSIGSSNFGTARTIAVSAGIRF
jgi:hypothetical protein